MGKRKRTVLTINQKIDICRKMKKGDNRDELMREYNVGLSAIYDIRAQKDRKTILHRVRERQSCYLKEEIQYQRNFQYGEASK